MEKYTESEDINGMCRESGFQKKSSEKVEILLDKYRESIDFIRKVQRKYRYYQARTEKLEISIGSAQNRDFNRKVQIVEQRFQKKSAEKVRDPMQKVQSKHKRFQQESTRKVEILIQRKQRFQQKSTEKAKLSIGLATQAALVTQALGKTKRAKVACVAQPLPIVFVSFWKLPPLVCQDYL